MRKEVFGNETAGKVLEYLALRGPLHASAVARECTLALTPVLNQLERFERAGLLASTMAGRNRVFRMRRSSPLFQPVLDILAIENPALLEAHAKRRRADPQPPLAKGVHAPKRADRQRPRNGGSTKESPEEPIVEGTGFLG